MERNSNLSCYNGRINISRSHRHCFGTAEFMRLMDEVSATARKHKIGYYCEYLEEYVVFCAALIAWACSWGTQGQSRV